jgi:hypothetical protein
MDINRNNYESWFLDYLDGNMETSRKEVLMKFLDFNPDLREELEGLEYMRLKAEEIPYGSKNSLLKNPAGPSSKMPDDDFETLCISYIENQLSDEESELLQNLLRDDPEKQKTYRLFKAAQLEPDLETVYPGKHLLKKRFIDIPGVRIAATAVAASIVIFLGLSLLFRGIPGREMVTESSRTPSITPVAKENGIPEEDSGTKSVSTGSPASAPLQEQPGSGSVQEQPGSGSAGTTRVSLKEKSVDQKNHSDQQGDIARAVDYREPFTLARIESIEMRRFQSLGEDHINGQVRQLHGEAYRYYLRSMKYGLAEAAREKESSNKLSFWRLADAGIQRINNFSEEEYSLERKVDENGRTRRFTFESPVFGISTPLGNTDEPQ